MKRKERNIEEIIDRFSIHRSVPKSYLIYKRLVDIVLSLIGIFLLIPLFLLTGLAVKLDSRGPVLFIQDRCGYRSRIFKMYKFRSMVKNAPQLQETLAKKNEAGSLIFKMKRDPRITRVGHFIRKTSIDELPQLLNVIKGDMSLVGPRPPLPDEVRHYNPWHYLKLSVKPGITGLWQIRGRSSVGFDEMVKLDLKYIRERSLIYDLKIILRTIPLLFGDKRAF